MRIFGQPIERQRQRIGYVPQRESVDWDFPVSVLDVVLMGTYGRLGWFRRPGAPSEQPGHASASTASAWPTWRRSRSASSPAASSSAPFWPAPWPRSRHLLHGRAVRRRRRRHGDAPSSTCCRKLREQGKTVIVVHHDLRTVPQYFDTSCCSNMRLVASGPTGDVFTEDNLRKTYGGRLAILETAGEAVQAREPTP